jgi:DNA-binding transcriptional ArsR family regulator
MDEADAVMGEDGRLPAYLAAALEARLQDALDHPVRREVLRVLDSGKQPRSIVELAAELRHCTLGQLNYHLQVLSRSGLVASEPAGVGPRAEHARYASEVLGDAQVLAVLEATKAWDRERREALGGEGQSPMAMFRIPRRGRSIRLGRPSPAGSGR